jgi:hypothetical protein
MQIFPTDPKDGKPSVSLGILMLATTTIIVAIGLQLADLAKDSPLAMEFFGIACALYFGRRVGVNKGSVSLEEKKDGQEAQ